MPIHATAIVDPRAEIDPSADIGPYAIIEAGVKIAAGCRIWPHAFIAQGTTLGLRVQVHPFATVGHHPQDVAWSGAPSYTTIGDDTLIREQASIHRGTKPESSTVVGQRVFVMATAHIGHNCTVGDGVILANSALLAGYVEVGSKAFLSGGASVHQFTRVGELAIAHGNARVTNDLPPYCMATDAGVVGLNVIGLRRAGFTAAERFELRVAYKTLYRSGMLFPAAIQAVAAMAQCGPTLRLLEWLRAPSKRGFLAYRNPQRVSQRSEADE